MKLNRHFSWQLASVVIAALVFFPLITIVFLANSADASIWSHLINTVLGDYVTQSLLLMLGVAGLTLALGIGSAWLVTQYNFTGVRFFNWALLLPLAMPAYIIAYCYTGLLDVAGPVQSSIRDTFSVQYGEYWFFEIRSLGGAIAVMSFVLYPYVYLLARASFLEQSPYLSDASRLLGYSRRQAFFKITLPIARPAIIAGLALALMETLADYGTVSYFGVSTFTTGIFRTWYGLDSLNSAAQLALVLLGFVIVLLAIEKTSRQKAKYHNKKSPQTHNRKKLHGIKQLIAIALCTTPLLSGFIIPSSQLLFWASQTAEQLLDPSFWQLVEHTISLAAITSILALALALIIAYSHRLSNSKLSLYSKHIAMLGYAIPGTVIAVGVFIPLNKLDNLLDSWLRLHFDISSGLLISGTIAALVIAYLVRFLAVSLQTVDSALNSITPNIDQAARSLGSTPRRTLLSIHIPMLRTSLFTALIVVFVDVMKELPATLILRPFNFNTLAVRAFELASDERLADAALPSLAIVLTGLIPVILLSNAIYKQP